LNVIFDLDGTLIDSRMRLYRLFCDLVQKTQLGFNDYWSLKRSKVSHEMILTEKYGYRPDEISIFQDQWMSLIETPDYLALDTKIECIEHVLGELQKQANLVVCTARQRRNLTISQLKRLGLNHYFSLVLVTEQAQSKEALLVDNLDITDQDWIVGDTGKDIEVGKSININTCAVTNGFICKEVLLSYSPDRMLGSVVEFVL